MESRRADRVTEKKRRLVLRPHSRRRFADNKTQLASSRLLRSYVIARARARASTEESAGYYAARAPLKTAKRREALKKRAEAVSPRLMKHLL